ncbi:hypothetical protein [Streptomyces sp. DT195]|uniref:hypothetical protein n=1 Tax=Streptomyces sp. DT195 TaxID=3393419 RepID=UPI003CF1A29D
MTFLAVVEGDAGGWRIDRDALTDAIRARWSEVEIDSMHRSEVRSLIWQFKTENGPGEAYLHEDGTCLYMDVWEEATGMPCPAYAPSQPNSAWPSGWRRQGR